MAISTILIIIIPLVILFFFLNIAARVLYDRLKTVKRQADAEHHGEAEHGRQRLKCYTHDVVVDRLRGLGAQRISD